MPIPPDDEVLAERARLGCADAFEELVRRYQVPLLHFLRERGTSCDAEDVLQETFVRAYRNLDRFRPKWRFSTWIFTIARRLSANQQRVRQSTSDAAVLDSLADEGADPARAVAQDESRRRLWDVAAEVLSEEQHTALWLYYVEEMPVKDIANVLNRFVPSVKTMLHRARRKLMPVLERMELERTVSMREDSGRTESNGSFTEEALRTIAVRRLATEVNHG